MTNSIFKIHNQWQPTEKKKIFFSLIIFASSLVVGFIYFTINSQYSAKYKTEHRNEYEHLEKDPDNADISINPQPPENISLVFGGDVMLDRYIRQVATERGYDFIFQELNKFFLDKDLVVVNLEGPITSFDSLSLDSEIGSKNNYIFTFDEKVSSNLSDNNIKLVNIGNNHILNFGVDGLNQTKKNLSNSDIGFFGNTGIDNTIYTTEIKGKKLAFINYNQFLKNDLEKTLDHIRQLKADNDFVFVYTHWGNEYNQNIADFQQELSHKFIDYGADAVIGSHPHVVQKIETYKGKKIYYSLGNLIFDQYFQEAVQEGLLVELIIKGSEISYQDYRVILELNGQTKLKN